LAGVYAPSAGRVSISGAIASLFELGGLGTRFITGREYADRLLRFQGVRGKRLAKLIEQVREFSELGDFFDRRIYTYSSGMAARLYFSVATAVRKDVFLIDELLSVGDEHFQAKCWRRIRDLLSNGASGVLVTHDWSAVIKLCEQSIILKQGEVAASGSSDGMVAAYLGLVRGDESKFRLEYPSSEAHAISGNDWTESFHLEVCCEGKIDFGFSIEMLRLGVGWEIMILSNMKEVANGPGKYQITVSIPKMPLVSGTYSLNLFLRHHQIDGKPFSLPLRSWTTGNGILLHVSGALAQTAVARPPLKWHFDRGGYAAN
jgi:lipopolysaccharide transport system ATP-binding protein